MSTLKVNTIDNKGSAVDFPNKLTVRGNAIEQGYTESGTEPSSPSEGDIWWDSTNEKVYQYINSEFKEISIKAVLKNAGDRAVHHGGYTSTSGLATERLDYWAISTLGNAADFGDLLTSQRSYGRGSVSDRTYGIFFPQYNTNTIERITFASTGNATDFGDTTSTTYNYGCFSDGTLGYFIHGQTGAGSVATANIDKFTIATAGNATDFGYDFNNDRINGLGLSDGTTGWYIGGLSTTSASSASTTVEYITLASASDSSDFGDLLYGFQSVAGASNLNRFVCCGGKNVNGSAVNMIQYFSTTTAGNATDFGDLLSFGHEQMGASCNGDERMCMAGGYATAVSSPVETIQYIEMGTPANAVDFGDLLGNSSDANQASGNAS